MSMWSTTFRRFADGHVPVVRGITVAVHDWARPRGGESRMFEHELLERVTLAHAGWPIAIYGPGAAALMWHAAGTGVSWRALAGGYAAGLVIWTLVEYVLHRFSFHHVPSTRLEVAIGYLVHGVHHAYPDDSRRWVMPLVVTLPIATALILTARMIGGASALPIIAGFIHGYVVYDTLHHTIHRGTNRTSIIRRLRKHHLQHHYATPDQRFGVSSPLWDVVFRTSR